MLIGTAKFPLKWICLSLFAALVIAAILIGTSVVTSQAKSKSGASITIVEKKGVVTFDPQSIRLQPNQALIWTNSTGVTQEILGPNAQVIKLAPGASSQTFPDQTYFYQLRSNAQAYVYVAVINAVPLKENTVSITQSGTQLRLTPSDLKVAPGTTLHLSNETDQTQSLVSENAATSSITISSRKEFDLTLSKAGTYRFHVKSAPTLWLTITVQ